ncbi:MAG: redoxin domain-containing protein [Polyangiaceae bacterium]|nr:redoxin domain-containing protein [Polyangiaceae bacterium]
MTRRTAALALLVASCSAGVPPPKPASRGAGATEPARASPSEPETPSVSPRGWLGVEVSVPPDAEGGVLVRSTIRGSPAELAGIVAGDRILKLDGADVVGPEDVVRLVAARAPGSRVPLVIRRGQGQRLLSAELGAAPDATSVMQMSFVDAPAPRLVSLEPVQGSVDPDLAQLKGRVVVLEFWAPWCVVCRFMVPKLNDWHARFSAQGVVVLGITMDAVVPATHAAGQLGIEYPVASDHTGKTTTTYRANALPTVFVIDKRGVVRDVLVGYSSDRLDRLERLVQDLTGER